MRRKSCKLENEVRECLRSDTLGERIREHICACPVCQDEMLVSAWMRQFQSTAMDAEMMKKILPQPEAIWKKAFAWKRADKKLVKKAMRPLIYPQVVSYIFIALGIVFLLPSTLKKVGEAIDLKALVHALPYFFIPMTVVIISMLFCGFVTAFEKRKKTA